jgi:carbon monoxide dehydrogenase subunit G
MPGSRFESVIDVPSNLRECWAVVTTIDRVAAWLGIISDVVEVRPLDYYEAVLSDRIGPFKVHADVTVRVSDVEAERGLTIRIEGEDRAVASRIKADARLTMAASAEGTRIELSGEYEVAGKVAAMGSSTIRKKANRIVDDFSRGLADALGASANAS